MDDKEELKIVVLDAALSRVYYDELCFYCKGNIRNATKVYAIHLNDKDTSIKMCHVSCYNDPLVAILKRMENEESKTSVPRS